MKIAKQLGALGGKARAKKLSKKRLSEIGKLGAKKRWEKVKKNKSKTKSYVKANTKTHAPRSKKDRKKNPSTARAITAESLGGIEFPVTA